MASMNGYDQGASPEARKDFELMPEGDYVGQITESEIKPNSKGTGQLLKLTWELLNAGFKDRRVWQQINVQHTNPQAQQIGQIEFANLKAGLGITGTVADTLMLHNKPCGLKLKIEKGEGQYKDKNVVFDFFPAQQFGQAAGSTAPVAVVVAPVAAPVAPVAVATPAANTQGRMPWDKAA